MIYEELSRHIDQAIENLPEQCRLIFRLSREHDLSYKDIAQKLNISVKTVDTQIGRALRFIRTRIAHHV
jgi:RNA polymerase sigma-70 factor (ECF subfamily)